MLLPSRPLSICPSSHPHLHLYPYTSGLAVIHQLTSLSLVSWTITAPYLPIALVLCGWILNGNWKAALVDLLGLCRGSCWLVCTRCLAQGTFWGNGIWNEAPDVLYVLLTSCDSMCPSHLSVSENACSAIHCSQLTRVQRITWVVLVMALSGERFSRLVWRHCAP